MHVAVYPSSCDVQPCACGHAAFTWPYTQVSPSYLQSIDIVYPSYLVHSVSNMYCPISLSPLHP